MFPVASVCSSHYHFLTSQVDLMNIKEIGKVEFYASFVNFIVAILLQRLVV